MLMKLHDITNASPEERELMIKKEQVCLRIPYRSNKILNSWVRKTKEKTGHKIPKEVFIHAFVDFFIAISERSLFNVNDLSVGSTPDDIIIYTFNKLGITA